MALVFACIAPHGGNLLLGKNEPTPVPKSRAAMAILEQELRASRPDTLALITPHGIYLEGAITVGVCPFAAGELDDVTVSAATDIDLAAAWAYRAAARDVPVVPLTTQEPGGALPLDWGATIPLALLIPHLTPAPRLVVACPARDLTRPQLIDWGEALVDAAEQLGKRVALIVSADQGHGHAVDGPYGYAPESAPFDEAMAQAIRDDDLPRLLSWDEAWIDAAMPDSYWQTLSLIGVQRRVPLRARLLSYEVDHYFGLLCAAFSL